jgi:hypothetical protein
VIPKGTVIFNGGRIVAVGEHLASPGNVQETIDGSGQTLLPGFIDSHTHAWGDALERALAFGVTTELDMFTTPEFGRQMRAEQPCCPLSPFYRSPTTFSDRTKKPQAPGSVFSRNRSGLG